jgi:hypothetical protein
MTKSKNKNAEEFAPVKVKSSDEHWSEFNLSDGSILRIRPIVIEVSRVKGKLSPEGKPIYQIKGGVMTEVSSPKKVAKPKKKSKARKI